MKEQYNMNKICIVSVSNHNFGSLLQTFALQFFIQKLGYKTEILKYKEPSYLKFYRFRNKEYTISRFKLLIKKLVSIYNRKYRENLKIREDAFKSFIDKRLQFTNLYKDKKALTNGVRKYNIVLLGSDQVWHPMNLYMDFFTLNFVPSNIKKIAYAPSFGVSTLPQSYINKYKKFISRFQYLSCRELSGINIIKSITNLDSKLVCDPTLLLSKSDWELFIDNSIKYNEKYILCYFIGNNPKQRMVVSEFARKEKCKIVALPHIDEYIKNDEFYADFTPYNVGPSEFLGLINNAEYIMTDSFHATVFSLLFHKKFYTFNRFDNGKGNSTSSRIDTLLSSVNLLERKIPKDANYTYLNSLKEINYTDVDKKIFLFKESSISYLTEALSNECK